MCVLLYRKQDFLYFYYILITLTYQYEKYKELIEKPHASKIRADKRKTSVNV